MSARKPTRNELIMLVASELRNLRITPSNPADINGLAGRAKAAQVRTRDLAAILSEMVPHMDNGGTLDLAREFWADYEREHKAKESE